MDRQTAADLLDNLIGMVDDSQWNDYDTALRMGIEALKADVQPVRHGRWMYKAELGWGETWVCSGCGERTTSTVMGKPRYKYCPMCGAIMDGD